MLVAHSSMDENVHIQNTMQMLTAFTNAGKDIDVTNLSARSSWRGI